MTLPKEPAPSMIPRLKRVLVASGIVTSILYAVLWSITNPGQFYAIWPVGNQAWAMVGFVVAGIVLFISGLCGFHEVIDYIRYNNCNIWGAFAGIFFFLLTASLLVLYGSHLYYQMEVYSKSPDLKIFTGWKCADVQKLGSQFPEVDLLHGYPYYYPDDYRQGNQLSNCGNYFHLTNDAVWNGTGWIEPTQHSTKAEWNGTQWLEPPTSTAVWNSTTTSWTVPLLENKTNTNPAKYKICITTSGDGQACYIGTRSEIEQDEKDLHQTYGDYYHYTITKADNSSLNQSDLTQGTNVSPDVKSNDFALTEGTKIQMKWNGTLIEASNRPANDDDLTKGTYLSCCRSSK